MLACRNTRLGVNAVCNPGAMEFEGEFCLMAPYRIRTLLENPERFAEMKRNAQLMGRPNAAHDIVRDILGRCAATVKLQTTNPKLLTLAGRR